MATATSTTLPHWDMSVVYPALDSPALADAFAALRTHIAALAALFDDHAVGPGEPLPPDDATAAALDTLLTRYNALLAEAETLQAYLYSFVATDSRNAQAQTLLSALEQEGVRLEQLGTRFVAWTARLDVAGLAARSPLAAGHAPVLARLQAEAAHLMSPAEEELAAELGVTGGSAWGKLHSNLTSQIMVLLEINGQTQELPMSVARNLAMEKDRDLRRRAYEAELAAWERHAVPLAAALNSIKGEVNTLSRRRGWDAPLDAALFVSRIDRETLDAMLEAARASFPDFRRYLRAKARLLGVPALAWYDLFAPVGSDERSWSFDDAAAFIVAQFGTYGPKLRDLAARAFAERWIDAAPRSGKVGGAFCMHLRGDESRILANYTPAFDSVSTLAHELGHAYHNLNLAARTPLQRSTPMTLAETASIFCETIIRHAGMAGASDAERLALLEASLQNACQVVVDISSRFLFESAVFEQRREHELSVDDFNALMLDAQRQTYGDGLDQNLLHPYMWAVKGHYYSSGLSFYNFPYMFGLLFGLGLYARYQADPEGFTAGYDELLSSTGLADAATLAERFGIDIRTPEFWRSSLDVVRADIDEFEQLAAYAISAS